MKQIPSLVACLGLLALFVTGCHHTGGTCDCVPEQAPPCLHGQTYPSLGFYSGVPKAPVHGHGHNIAPNHPGAQPPVHEGSGSTQPLAPGTSPIMYTPMTKVK